MHLRWEETKEGDTVHGARLTIETGAGFPISIMNTAPIATAHNGHITFCMGSSSKVAKGPRDETGAAPRLDGDSRESHGLRPCAATQDRGGNISPNYVRRLQIL